MRTILLLLMAVLAGSVATQAQAQAPAGVSIAAGEEVVVRIVGAGRVEVVSRGPAPPMTPFDAYSLADLVATKAPPGATTLPPKVFLKGEGPPPPPAARGVIRLVLRDVVGATRHDALLLIENGYEQGFRYRALMRRGERSAPTDVCLIMPGKPGHEHWPYQIDRLDLSDLRLVPWKPEDGLPCA